MDFELPKLCITAGIYSVDLQTILNIVVGLLTIYVPISELKREKQNDRLNALEKENERMKGDIQRAQDDLISGRDQFKRLEDMIRDELKTVKEEFRGVVKDMFQQMKEHCDTRARNGTCTGQTQTISRYNN